MRVGFLQQLGIACRNLEHVRIGETLSGRRKKMESSSLDSGRILCGRGKKTFFMKILDDGGGDTHI